MRKKKGATGVTTTLTVRLGGNEKTMSLEDFTKLASRTRGLGQMHFAKIKYEAAEDKVELRWTEIRVGGTEVDHVLRASETPAPEFVDALAAFVPLVLDLLELPTAYGDGFRVQSLSINEEEKDGRLGLVVTCLKTLGRTNAPLVLNTPHLREPMEGTDVGPGFLSSELGSRLDDAQKAARDFLDGKRAQGELFEATAK